MPELLYDPDCESSDPLKRHPDPSLCKRCNWHISHRLWILYLSDKAFRESIEARANSQSLPTTSHSSDDSNHDNSSSTYETRVSYCSMTQLWSWVILKNKIVVDSGRHKDETEARRLANEALIEEIKHEHT